MLFSLARWKLVRWPYRSTTLLFDSWNFPQPPPPSHWIPSLSLSVASQFPFFPSHAQEEDCVRDVRTSSRNDRIRVYEELLGIDTCPVPLYYLHEWLRIDNATEEDTRHTYSCIGNTTFLNPFPRRVSGVLGVTFTPGRWFLCDEILQVGIEILVELEKVIGVCNF